jgi:signal transduction histidine kinase
MRSVTYSARLIVAIVLAALLTTVITFALLTIVLEQRLWDDSGTRRDAVAEEAANLLSRRYEAVGGWTGSTTDAMSSVAELSDGIGVEVMAMDGSIIYSDLLGGAVRAGSTGGKQSARDMPAAQKSAAPIFVNGTQVGMVFAFSLPDAPPQPMNGDVQFNVYVAVFIAGLIAVTLAGLYGVFFAREFVQPLTHITTISNRVRAGDLSARTRMEGSDELSRLGRAVDEMIDAVEKNKKLEHQLTTDVAHELRTPLMAMQATIEAMIDGVLPVDSVRLATLNSEVIRLGRLVDVQMELSRLESGSTTLRVKALDLSQLVKDLVISHEMFIEDAGLILDCEILPGVMVRGDADRLRQAISNLFSNAIRYTSSGGHIKVRVCAQQGLAQVFVSDTGVGIAGEDMPHVFERFWRAATSRDRESGGLGVGLALVREIATRHRGVVNVESVLGVGSTFTLSLPLLGQPEYNKRGQSGSLRQGGIPLQVGLQQRGRAAGTRGAQKPPPQQLVTQGSQATQVAQVMQVAQGSQESQESPLPESQSQQLESPSSPFGPPLKEPPSLETSSQHEGQTQIQ